MGEARRKAEGGLRLYGIPEYASANSRIAATICHFDADSPLDEDRYVAIGFSAARLLAVVFVNRDADTTRIISARKALRSEEKRYERGY
ncbi:BrnT family toxin [Duganella aquatilis]|uniref:BrnT family toxin n=1 Tax=Duganella aquatilis TaxID=2666082 RepID=UPI0012AEF9DA